MTGRFWGRTLCCALLSGGFWGLIPDRGAIALSLDCADLTAFADSGEAPATLKGAAFCGESLRPGGQKARHCAWAHPYRAPEAVGNAEILSERIESCLKATADQSPDARVNHPDSYDLRRWRMNGQTISLSIKDKAARGQTFVFLTITDPAADD